MFSFKIGQRVIWTESLSYSGSSVDCAAGVVKLFFEDSAQRAAGKFSITHSENFEDAMRYAECLAAVVADVQRSVRRGK